jgi:hypothetical protein
VRHERYHAIARHAKEENADLFFWDESGFRADAVHGKTWGLPDQTPVVQRPGQRQLISAASAVNAKGTFWFKKACVREHVESTNEKLALHFLPGDAPDLNPDELIWTHVKRTGAARRPLRKVEKFQGKVIDQLGKVIDQLAEIRDQPACVRSFFRTPSVASVAYIRDY